MKLNFFRKFRNAFCKDLIYFFKHFFPTKFIFTSVSLSFSSINIFFIVFKYVFKIISGDKSDNIDGIYYLGEKTIVKLFPEILEIEVSFTDILTKGEELLKEQKDNTVLKNLLTGKTKEGIFGDEFFEINKKIVDLSEPLISEEGKELVESYYSESLDPD